MKLTGIILAGGKSSRFNFNKLKIKAGSVPLLVDQILKLCFFCDEIIISTSKENYPLVSSQLCKINKYLEKYNPSKIRACHPRINMKSSLNKITALPDIKIIQDKNNFSFPDDINYGSPGPITGIYSALADAAYFYSLIIAFDMPFISHKLLKTLICESGIKPCGKIKRSVLLPDSSSEKDVCVIRRKKGFEVLCGIYSKNCTGTLKNNIKKKNYKISDIFTLLDVKIISEEKLKSRGIDNLNFFNINRPEDYSKYKKIWRGKKNTMGPGITFTDIWSNFFFRGLN